MRNFMCSSQNKPWSHLGLHSLFTWKAGSYTAELGARSCRSITYLRKDGRPQTCDLPRPRESWTFPPQGKSRVGVGEVKREVVTCLAEAGSVEKVELPF